jgi:hypothetical protein
MFSKVVYKLKKNLDVLVYFKNLRSKTTTAAKTKQKILESLFCVLYSFKINWF